jgi:AcrR family transcriptional regulator
MVATPWGDSESLRARMLRPGPGAPAKEVAENQRERLFGAMVTSAAERGYAATRVADLSQVSGVSSRSFYDLFPDKQACFVATLEALQAMAADLDGEGGGDAAARVRLRLQSLAAWVGAQPAAARLCLIELFAAGPAATRPLDDAVARAETALARALVDDREEETPAPVITVLVGAVVEVARNRLLGGEEESLPTAGEELAALLLDSRPPTRPLRLARRPAVAKAELPEALDHAERGLRAFESLLAEQGYAETTMEQVAKRAAMSARTLYANFDDKRELLLAAIDSAGAQIVAAALPAFRRNASWPEGVRAALGALLGLLASRPEMARMMMDGLFAEGPAAQRRRLQTLRPLVSLLDGGRRYAPQAPAIAPEALLFGVLALCRGWIRGPGPGTLPSLLPLATYAALMPFLGAEQATAVARGEESAQPVAVVEPPVAAAGDGFRADRHLVEIPLAVDEEGWGEIGGVLDAALGDCREIQKRSEKRLEGGAAEAISARAVLSLFEAPPASPDP